MRAELASLNHCAEIILNRAVLVLLHWLPKVKIARPSSLCPMHLVTVYSVILLTESFTSFSGSNFIFLLEQRSSDCVIAMLLWILGIK